ncbi:UTRA domain-containing protein [Sphingomonas sp. MMS24-J13]|uniref:UTRA domain-containing protein n=1 Tax=Sphingomonas sp. MMS24-J13 TaxID=3238686 RepID=UPI00384FA56F
MSLPLHERIRADIEGQILSGTLAPGDRIPTEHALMAEHGCSRMTVNKALSSLAAARLIDRRKRAGSFVAHPRLHAMILDVPDLPQEVLARGQCYEYRLLTRKVKPSKPAQDKLFDVGPGRVLEVSGIHLADGRPLAVEHRQVSLESVPSIEDAAFDRDPPGTWLLRHVPWTEAETRISASAADSRTAALLQVQPGAPLLQIERRTWRGDDPITAVRQSFLGSGYDLFARFNATESAKR